MALASYVAAQSAQACLLQLALTTIPLLVKAVPAFFAVTEPVKVLTAFAGATTGLLHHLSFISCCGTAAGALNCMMCIVRGNSGGLLLFISMILHTEREVG